MKVLLRIFVLALYLGVFLFPVFGQEPGELTRALREAISKSDIATATFLLKAGANPNGIYKEEYGTTFLMEALDRRKNQLAELLLDYGADPDARNNYGRSAVYTVGSRGNSAGLALLISRGARFDIIDNEKKSPLMYSIESYSGLPVAALILEWEETHTPGFTAGYNTRQDYLSALLPPFFKRSFTYDDDSDLKLVERLLSLGANPAVLDNNGIHVFHNIRSSHHYRQEMLALFFDYGAPLDSVDRYDKTLLMRATESSRKDSAEVEFLLNRGANPNFQNKEGETALISAWRYPEAQRALLDAGADPSIRDNEGRNVLFTIREGAINMGLLDDFLAGGCDINAYSTRGYTPIMSAADSYDSVVVLALLERGADPLLLDDNGRTALQIYLAARALSSQEKQALEIEVITALLEAGVQPATLDTRGDSALFYVMRRTDPELKPIQDLLLEYSSDDDKEIAIAMAAAEKKRDARQAMSKNKTAITWGIGIPLVTVGLGVLARENLSANFMREATGAVTGALTLGTAGLFLGAFMGGMIYGDRGSSLDDLLGTMAYGFLGGTLGLIGGIVVGCLPPVRRAFAQNPALFYAPTAIIGGSIILLSIRR